MSAGLTGFHPEICRRILAAIACRDADPVPKVPGAGTIRHRGEVPVQVMHNGLVIELGCYFGPWMTRIIESLHGHHEPQEELVVHAMLERLERSGDRGALLELGSWWAYYAMWFARARPGCRVVAMEPDPEHLDVGRRNARLNGLEDRIAFVQGVVGPRPGDPADFVGEVSGRWYRVVQHDLESLMAATVVARAAIVLADVQGAETVLLERARGALAERVRFLVVSTHRESISGSPTTHRDVLDLLACAGATIVAEHTVEESASGDGLVAASLDPRDRGFRVGVSRLGRGGP